MKTFRNNLSPGLLKLFVLTAVLLAFTQCRKDEDENFRIRVENHCDFAIKVYYDNQEIEYYDEYIEDVTVVGAVTFIPPGYDKIIYSKYASVWVEPEFDDIPSRKFRSHNDGPWRKLLVIHEYDFY